MKNLHSFLKMIIREGEKKMQPNDMAAVLIERKEIEWLNNYMENRPVEDSFSMLAGLAMGGMLAQYKYSTDDKIEVAARAISFAKELHEQLKKLK